MAEEEHAEPTAHSPTYTSRPQQYSFRNARVVLLFWEGFVEAINGKSNSVDGYKANNEWLWQGHDVKLNQTNTAQLLGEPIDSSLDFSNGGCRRTTMARDIVAQLFAINTSNGLEPGQT